MFKLFSRNTSVNIVLPKECDISIKLAAKDLRKNLLMLSGKTEGFSVIYESEESAINVICDPLSAPNYKEGYRVEIKGGNAYITGYDDLGTVYGIYAFATKILGIDPMYNFTDVFPNETQELCIQDTVITSTKKTTPYRGWFINDEDLLSCFRPNGAKRAINYNQEFFKEVIPAYVLDSAFETALRLEMNLIIPCSYLDILNPAEEAIVKAATDRGLYVSQHHQEPVGVAHFAAENYINLHYPGMEVSYVKNPKQMEEVWQVYAEKWVKYNRRIIWQLGLRGQGDKAVWQSDGNISASQEQRGGIITNAIATQHAIISKLLGHSDFISTTTLWLEGAELYSEGYLKIPHGTITVFSDIGDTQLFGADFYSVKRKPEEKYGIYYHAAFFMGGPHFTDGVDPKKMLYCYRQAQNNGSLEFSVLNVANIREVAAGIRLNAAILNGSPLEFDLDNYYENVYKDIFQDQADSVAELEKEYYTCIGDLGKYIGKDFLSVTNFYYYEYNDVDFPHYPLTDGIMFRIGGVLIKRWNHVTGGKSREYINEISVVSKQSSQKYSLLLEKIEQMREMIPKNALYYYDFSQRYRCRYMRELSDWLYAVTLMVKGENIEANRTIALEKLDNIASMRKEFSTGKWQGWYDGDLRIDLKKHRYVTERYMKE